MTGAERAVATTVLGTSIALATGLVISLEGYSPAPYYDVAGVLTDCYGNTHNVSKGKVRTKAECNALVENEVGRIGAMLIKDQPEHNINTLASGISFVYNIGDGAYRNSTYRRRLREGNFQAACQEMNRWVYITKNGRKVKSRGLMNRRTQEVELCLTEP